MSLFPKATNALNLLVALLSTERCRSCVGCFCIISVCGIFLVCSCVFLL
jgi:hypothetical protein